ncbi:hypothetical protein B296_00002759, partial [Ensete ventricosum]
VANSWHPCKASEEAVITGDDEHRSEGSNENNNGRRLLESAASMDTSHYKKSQAHLAPQSSSKFNFQKYIKRSLEDDFKVVVGIRYDD